MAYDTLTFTSREEWLKARGIGGTDLCAIVNGKGRWESIYDVYDRLTSQKEMETLEEEKLPSEEMKKGLESEKSVRDLYLINHKEYKEITKRKEVTLLVDKAYPETTLSPDTLVVQGDGFYKPSRKGFVEIKTKQVYSFNQIDEYLSNLKENEPQYYWQLIHYFLVGDDLEFGDIVFAFTLMKHDDMLDKWYPDKIIIDSLSTTREAVALDIEVAREAVRSFIEDNLRPHIRPRCVEHQNQRKEENEIWTRYLTSSD